MFELNWSQLVFLWYCSSSFLNFTPFDTPSLILIVYSIFTLSFVFLASPDYLWLFASSLLSRFVLNLSRVNSFTFPLDNYRSKLYPAFQLYRYCFVAFVILTFSIACLGPLFYFVRFIVRSLLLVIVTYRSCFLLRFLRFPTSRSDNKLPFLLCCCLLFLVLDFAFLYTFWLLYVFL